MSDTPEARPGAPRPPAKAPAAPSTPAVARPMQAPRIPTATPRAPAVLPESAPTPREPLPSVPDSEDELHLASSAVIPAAEELEPAPAPPPPPVPSARRSYAPAPLPPRPPSSADIVTSVAPTPVQPPVAPQPVEVATSASAPGESAQEQVTAILRAVLESTLAPMLAKQQELEARLQALQKTPTQKPPAVSVTPVRSMAPSVDITGSFAPNGPGPMRPSLISTSYGLVSVMPGPPQRTAMDEALDKVGPIDVPDFAGNRKFAGRIVIAILILGVVVAVVAMILSYS